MLAIEQLPDAADADEQTLARLGVRGTVPCESTIRRVQQRLDQMASIIWPANGPSSAPCQGRARGGSPGIRLRTGWPSRRARTRDEHPLIPDLSGIRRSFRALMGYGQ